MTSIIYEETFFFSVDRQANYLFNDNILSLLCKQVLFMCIPPPPQKKAYVTLWLTFTD